MATIKYILQSKSLNAPIYLRLSLGRGKSFKRKTSLSINPKNWSDKGYPKQTTAENKNLASELRGLNSFVLDQLNIANSIGTEISGEWLKSKIDLHFNKFEIKQNDYLAEYGKYFVKKLKYKTSDKSESIGVSRATEKKYKTIVNKIITISSVIYESFTANSLRLLGTF